MKKTIGVIFGGRSVEHDVSIITAHNPIIDSLLATQKPARNGYHSGGYEVVPIYISKDGSWYSNPKMNKIDFFKTDLDEKLAKLRKIKLDINNGFKIIIPKTFGNQEIKIDIIFPAMHGTYGEDGSLMGLLRMSGVPFVGCDIFASSVAMDKILTKQVLKSENIPVVKDVWFTKDEYQENKTLILEKINNNLTYPLFIKPVHLGSSIGISKVLDEKGLENAIEVALHYDDKVLVEEGVNNLIEVTLPIMGNERPITAEVEKPLNKKDFFDYEEKYLNGGKKTEGVNNNYSEIPANIGEEMTKKIKRIGTQVYKILGCSGIARIDFLIDSETKNVFVNEVNTLPGSLYQHNWKKSGVSNIELVEKLIDFAKERSLKQKDTTYSFKSTILDNHKK